MEYTVFVILAPIALAFVVITQLVLWRYRKEEVGRALIVYFALVVIMVLTNILELLSQSERATLFWAAMAFPLVSAVPLAWLHFAFSFTGAKISQRRLLWGSLSIVPAITLVLSLTIEHHGFIYSTVDYLTRFGYSTVEPTYGMWFWFNGVFHYVLLIFGAVIIIRHMAVSGSMKIGPAFWVAAGIFLPLIVNALYLLPLNFFVYKDFTPIAFAATGVFFFVGVYWQRMLQIVPQARSVVIDTMDQSVMIFDTGDILVDFNPAASRLGIEENHIGEKLEDIPAVAEILGNHGNGDLVTFETTRSIAGRTHHLDVYLRPVSAGGKQHLGKVLIVSDVTLRVELMEDRMKLAAETQKANNELKRTQLRMIHREKLASIGQLSAGLAHEMKNPVGYLQSNLRVLRRMLESLSARFGSNIPDQEIRDIREVLDDSEDGFLRILTVVDNLLQFSRPGGNGEKQYYDLNKGIETTLQIAGSLIRASGDIRIDKDLALLDGIQAFPGEINQVILNLLTNAVHSVQGVLSEQGLIKIQTWQDEKSVYCRISNNGPPIEPEILERIFEPFFSTKDAGRGTGLGLSIARDIITGRHGGHIEAKSDRKLTKFTFSLPH